MSHIFERIWDLRTIRLDEGADGMKRSWIMLMPEGQYTHPSYGKLNFTKARLLSFKQHFDDGVRGIEIALDENHNQDKATGWVEAMQWRPAQGDLPAGLWGQVRWTELGEHDISAQIYRYFSPEFGPHRDEKTGEVTNDVLIGGGLTNRPFLKDMPAVHLAEGVSHTPWASINKACLPRSCFLDPGDAADKSTWRLPIYEGAGPKDADGHYTQRGALNVNGVKAAWAAVNGAHTGQKMDVSSSIRSKLQSLMQQYFGATANEGEARMIKKKARGLEFDEETQQFAKKAKDVADGEEYADDEEMDEGDDSEDETDDGADDDEEDVPPTKGKVGKGKFAPRDFSKGGKGQKMTEPKSLRDEVVRLREVALEQGRRLYEMEVGEILAAWESGQVFTFDEAGSRVKDPDRGEIKKRQGRIAITPKGARAVRAFMLAEGFTLAESTRGAVLDLVQTLLSEQLVDLSARGSSFDMEARKTTRGGTKRDADASENEVSLAETAASLAAADKKDLKSLSLSEREAYFLRAAQEVSY
jgi:hypothetical protein